MDGETTSGSILKEGLKMKHRIVSRPKTRGADTITIKKL